ncbi:MAG: hypothetical protein LAP85_19125 [Acidobacteriia bacterium]|nr:hypothetical protein [Terriglobia bacterium]
MKASTRYPAWQRFQVHRDLALLVLVVIGCAVPFLSQPFHMDDSFYMDMARGARAHPLHPYDVPYDFGGFHVPDMASHSHPPLQAYFLAVVQRFAGEGEGREWIFHTVALLFPLLAAVSMYFIAAVFVERPIWPSLVMSVCPLVLIMEHTLMADLPTLAFWLAASACFLWATELSRKGLYVASALFQFAAMFASYQAIALVPLLGFYHIRKRGRAAGWFSLLLPLAGMCAWLGVTSAHYGRLVLRDTFAYVQSNQAAAPGLLGTKALALLQYQGWLIVFPFFLLYIFARGMKGRVFGLALLVSIYAAQAEVPGYRIVDKAIFVVGLVTGLFITVRMLALLRKAFVRGTDEVFGFTRVEAQFIALWYFGVAAYCLILFTGGSARYILPLVPPLLIFFFRWLEVSEVSEYRSDRSPILNSAMVASGSLVLSLAWGLFLAQADFEFARIYPRAAAAFSRLSSGLDSYVTGEWGFRCYFARIGAEPLPARESSVRGGSLLVKPKLAMPYDAPADLVSMTIPYASLSFDLRTPFRTMDWRTPAGFYSTAWGLIPFSLSAQSLETLEIRQVSFMVERLPWARLESASGVMPWPGLVPIGGGTTAVLAKPGTRITYPWELRHSMLLNLQIGVLHDGASAGDTVFEFEILHCDARGKILSRIEKGLCPGTRKEDREWQPVRLLLPASVAAGETLAFRYGASGPSGITGAFAQALLTPKETK